MAKANEAELDLVKISPNAVPPVCKLMDYGKYRFEQTKRDKEAKKNQRIVEIKEVRMSPGIDVNDFNVKVRNAQRFLADGNRVKVAVRFRGREMAHTDIGKRLLEKFAEEHRGERSYNMPHILGTPFEESYNHCFSTDGAPYLIRLGFLDPKSELFEQMETFYREIGMLDDEHGLASRMTNDDCGSPGLYGHVY